MDREIEFRGKEIDTGKWVYGSLINKFDADACCVSSSYIIEKFDFSIDADNNKSLYDVVCLDDYFEVDEKTLGQFTGLCDKDGKKIYEGDIVEFETNVNCITSELKPYWKDCYEKQYALSGGSWWVRKDQAIVQWNSKDGMWDLKVYNNGRYKRKSKLFTFRDSDYVVVGNIYDNPKLLGGGDEECDN